MLLHVEQRYAEGPLLVRCRAHGVMLVADSPLGQRLLVRRGRDAATRAVLDEVAREQGSTPHAVALAFLLRSPGVVVVPKASNAAHVEANAAAAQLALTTDQLVRIDAAFPRSGTRRAYT